MTKKVRGQFSEFFGLDKEVFSSKLLKTLTTFVLICFSWIFFRAESFSAATTIIKNMFSEFNLWILTDGTIFSLGLDSADMFVLLISLMVLFTVSCMKYKNINIRAWLAKQGLWFRFFVYLAGVFAVLIFGIYGPEYDASQFIYFQF